MTFIPSGLKQTVIGNTVAFDWNDSTDADGIKQYEIQTDNNSDFSSPEYSVQTDGSEASGAVLAVGISYYWRVRAQDKIGNWSAWSNPLKFVLPPVDTGMNTRQLAQDISSPDNWVGFGDAADYYKLTMTGAGTLTLGLTGLGGNADLSLLNAAGAVLKSSAKAGTADEAISNVLLLGGTYYVKVAAGSGVTAAAYTLSDTVDYFPVDTGANTRQLAQDISSPDNWVGFGDAADYYKLTMTGAGTLTLGLTGLGGNADLSLLNAAGAVLKSSAKAGTADEAISNVLLLGGTYYVKVAAGSGVTAAAYTLSDTVDYFQVDTGANTRQLAQDISSPDNWVGFGDAVDYYKLTMTGAGTLTLGLTGLGGNADLSLLNANGAVLKSSANAGITNEAINNVLLSAGTYYVRVAAGSGVTAAAYTLSDTVNYFPAATADNTYATATELTLNIGDDVSAAGWVGFGDATNFYKITASDPGIFDFALSGGTGTSAILTLYSLQGGKLTVVNTASMKDGAAAISDQQLTAGTWYFAVDSADKGKGAANTAYTLTARDNALSNGWQTAVNFSWAAYYDSADSSPSAELLKVSGWKPLAATDIGFVSNATNGSLNADGEFNGGTSNGSNMEAIVSTGTLNGKTTAVLAFTGTDDATDVIEDIIAGISNNWDTLYAKYSALVNAFDSYVSKNGIEQVLVTGHSLGGELAEEYMKNHSGDQYLAYTFGSPGSASSGSDSRMLQFAQPDDPIVNSSLGVDASSRTGQVFLCGKPDTLINNHAIANYTQRWLPLYNDWYNTRIEGYQNKGEKCNYFIGDSSNNSMDGTTRNDVYFFDANSGGSDEINDGLFGGGKDTVEILGVSALSDVYFKKISSLLGYDGLEITFNGSSAKLKVDNMEAGSFNSGVIENLRLFNSSGTQVAGLNMAGIFADYSSQLSEKKSLNNLLGANGVAYNIS